MTTPDSQPQASPESRPAWRRFAVAPGEVRHCGGPAAVAAAEQLSQLIRAEHLAFATTGDPGWAQFRTPQRMTRVYSPDSVLITYPEERSRALWSDQQFGVLSVNT